MDELFPIGLNISQCVYFQFYKSALKYFHFDIFISEYYKFQLAGYPRVRKISQY